MIPPVSTLRSQQMKQNDDYIIDFDAETEITTYDNEKMYGAILGTFLVCSFVEIVLAFVNPKVGVVVVRSCLSWVELLLLRSMVPSTTSTLWLR